MQASNLEFCLQLAKGIARQFGPNCEVVVHDLASNDPETSIVAIENGHVSGRRVGDGLRGFTATDLPQEEPEHISRNVADLLDELIEQSVKLVGKPVALMNKEDKVKAIQFLNDTGAFLITKSGYKVCKYFGISKYTLYSYIDEAKSASEK